MVSFQEVRLQSLEALMEGAIIQPYLHYPDGTQALLYLEEWRAESGKVVISTFPTLMSLM